MPENANRSAPIQKPLINILDLKLVISELILLEYNPTFYPD